MNSKIQNTETEKKGKLISSKHDHAKIDLAALEAFWPTKLYRTDGPVFLLIQPQPPAASLLSDNQLNPQWQLHKSNKKGRHRKERESFF